MCMGRLAIILTAACLFGVALVGRPVVVRASCAAPVTTATAVAIAPTVFIGTVTAVSHGDRVASVRVDDVWRGRVSPAVEVVGTPELSAAATSVDRAYTRGVQYLFVPSAGGPDGFQDNNCTATQPYAASMAALRPSDAPGALRVPAGHAGGLAPATTVDLRGAPAGAPRGWWPLAAVVVVASLLGVSAIVLMAGRVRRRGRGRADQARRG